MTHQAASDRTVLCGVLLLVCAGLAVANPTDAEEVAIRNELDAFLANVDDVEAHEAFWADDLVYTSSTGSRTNKQAIIESMRASGSAATGSESPSYSAEDVDVRVYGNVAVLAFRLVAESRADGRSEFFNTGTLLRRDGRWQVVAWQATRIPDAAAGTAAGQD